MSDQWLNNLRGKMENHEQDVPDGLWNDIREELFSEEEGNNKGGLIGTDSAVEKDQIRSNKPWLYRICGIAAAVVLLFFISRELLDFNTEKIRSKKETVSEKENERMLGAAAEKNPNSNEYPHADIYLNNSHVSHVIESAALGNNQVEKIGTDEIISQTDINDNTRLDIQKTEELLSQENQSTRDSAPISTLEKVATEESHEEEFLLKKENKQQEKYADTDRLKSAKRHSKDSWMLSMLTGNASRNSAEQQFPGYATINGSPMSVDEIFSSSSSHEDPLMEILMANQNKEVEARLRHKIPVTFGISLYYNLGKKWGIGTGLNYTKLSSELHSGSNSNYIKGEQNVHYIGVPVQINYNVIQKGRFTGYITGGALIEKAVAGSLKTKYIVEDEVKEVSEKELDMKPLQFSVNTAVGLQVKVFNKFGIYAEPGIGYHFKDNTSLNTIYKEKPLNFNMKFGVRILID